MKSLSHPQQHAANEAQQLLADQRRLRLAQLGLGTGAVLMLVAGLVERLL